MHSTSKGFYGECGFRGGMFQLENFPQNFLENVEKIVSINLCSNILGQVGMSLVCNPPTLKYGNAHALFEQEKNAQLGALKDRSVKTYNMLKRQEHI